MGEIKKSSISFEMEIDELKKKQIDFLKGMGKNLAKQIPQWLVSFSPKKDTLTFLFNRVKVETFIKKFMKWYPSFFSLLKDIMGRKSMLINNDYDFFSHLTFYLLDEKEHLAYLPINTNEHEKYTLACRLLILAHYKYMTDKNINPIINSMGI